MNFWRIKTKPGNNKPRNNKPKWYSEQWVDRIGSLESIEKFKTTWNRFIQNYAQNHDIRILVTLLVAGLFRVNLDIEFRCQRDLGKCSGNVMIIRWPTGIFFCQWHPFGHKMSFLYWITSRHNIFDTVAIPNGGNARAMRGNPVFISSKNWPRDYPNNEDWAWILTAPSGNNLNVTFLFAAFEGGCYDKVYLYEGKDINFVIFTLQ